MRSIRLFAWLITLGMAAAVAYGVVEGGLGADFDAIWARPWGRVSLVDLYLGFAVFAAWIWYRERGSGVVWLWWAGLVVLGNLVAGVYLLMAAYRSSDPHEFVAGGRVFGEESEGINPDST